MNRLLHVGNSKELRSLKLKVHITRSIWDCGGAIRKPVVVTAVGNSVRWKCVSN